VNKIEGTNIWLGDIDDAENIAALDENKIDVVVNMAKGLYPPVYRNQEMIMFGMYDDGQAEDLTYYLAARTVLELNKAGKNILLHCYAGASRTAAIATIVSTVLFKFDGTLYDQIKKAYDLVCDSRYECTYMLRRHVNHFVPVLKRLFEENSIDIQL